MREKHLTYFKVENFKRFESFEMNNIGQFNLILGDNNCGKTTVLEALLFDEDVNQLINHFHQALWYKVIRFQFGSDTNIFQYFYNLKKENSIKFGYKLNESFSARGFAIETITLDKLNEDESLAITNKILQNPGRRNLVRITGDANNTIEFQHAKASLRGGYFPFIPYGLGYEVDLVSFFSIIQRSTEILNEAMENLKLFIPELMNIEVSLIQDLNNMQILIVREKGRDQPLPLTMYGEGTVKLFRILLEIVMCKGQRLMIDEVDTGVHYSHFKDFWKTILKAAKRNDVQIFATTHNIECLKYLKECLEDDDMKDYQALTNCFELMELPDKSIKAYNYNFEQFENAINTNTNIRGGK